jgi:hypothetical protein
MCSSRSRDTQGSVVLMRVVVHGQGEVSLYLALHVYQ